MIKFPLVGLFVVLTALPAISQNSAPSTTSDSAALVEAEQFLLTLETDSALAVLNSIADEGEDEYLGRLRRLAGDGQASYVDFERFFSAVTDRSQSNIYLASDFLNFKVEAPKGEKIDMDYVKLRFKQTDELRNLNRLENANEVYDGLDDYISQFDSTDVEVIRARLWADVHPIVMTLIKGEIEKGEAWCQRNEQIAKEIKDTTMIIAAIFNYTDFYFFRRDLDGYIELSEKCYEWEQQLKEPSAYAMANQIHLINAYAFKGGKDEVVWKLLNELEEMPGGKLESYSLYCQYLGNLPPEHPHFQLILEKFGATDIEGFRVKMEELIKTIVDPNVRWHTLDQLSFVLENNGMLREAMSVVRREMVANRKTYSLNLAQSVADFQTAQAVKIQQVELKSAKEKGDLEAERATLYFVVAGLAAGLMLIALFALLRKSRQARTLAIQGKEIARQRDEIAEREAEKGLLLKEVHHRVKNNFQIVSSLLELQSKGIEDEKARELAEEGKNRVKSMALIHQRLYQNDDLLIYFDEYIGKLVDEISVMYGDEKTTDIDFRIPKVGFDIDTAIPLGLIVNELVTNAFKYGFGDAKRKLAIAIEKDTSESYKLIVTDNGKGLAPGFDISKAKSLGLRLVRRLSKQLQGRVDYSSEAGASFTVWFKDTNTRAAIN